MRSKDTCPSCGETVTPGDLLCWNCELILDPSQIPDRPSGDLSVVRRMLEVPQRGVPSARPQRAAPATSGASPGRNDGPTKVFALGRERGVPLVVASLSKKAARLSELEAFVVSFIDGESDVPVLAERAGLGVLELGVVLQALNDKMIVDFADEPADEVDAPAPERVEPASQQTLLGDEVEVDPNPTDVPPVVERRPGLRPQETPEEALARQQPTPPRPGERTFVGEPPQARPPATERVSAEQLAAASRRGPPTSTSGEQTPVEGALQAPAGLATALTQEFEHAPISPTPTEALAPVPDAPNTTSSTDRELREVEVTPERRAPPTVLLSADDIARAQATTAAAPAGLALSEEAFVAALAAPTAQVAAEVQAPLEDTDERPAHRLHEADAVEPPRTTSGESIIFASSWPTVHPSFFDEPAPKPTGVKSASFVVSPTPRSLEPVADQPSIIVAPMTGEHGLLAPPPPPQEEPVHVPAAPPAIEPVTAAPGVRRRRTASANRDIPPVTSRSTPAEGVAVAPVAARAERRTPGRLRSEAKGVGGRSGAEPSARVDTPPQEPARASSEVDVPAPRPSVTPLEPVDPVAAPSVTPPQPAEPFSTAVDPPESSVDPTASRSEPFASSSPPAVMRPGASWPVSQASVTPPSEPRASSSPPAVMRPGAARSSTAPQELLEPTSPLAVTKAPSSIPQESAALLSEPRASSSPPAVTKPGAARPFTAPQESAAALSEPMSPPAVAMAGAAGPVPNPASTPPELPSGPVPVAPASRPRRTLPGAGRVTASRPAPPIVLDAPGSRPPGATPAPLDALGPSGTVPEGVLSPVPPRPAPLVVAPMPVARAEPAPNPRPAAVGPVAGARTPVRPAFPEGPRMPEGRAETRPEVPADLPLPIPTAPLDGGAPSLADNPPPSTDPRIINRGNMNKRVLDALKQVKRRDASSEPAAPREEPVESVADRLAAGPLQVALRMEQNGRLEEAIRFLEKSIAQSPDAPSLYNRLAIILMRERADLRRAEQLLQKAVELAPENTVYDTNLKAVLAKRAMTKK
ncbi:MAG: hypothetical protein SFW67_15310 [Myxococcaceae bacterium]|nr:hypothetical protein [Myxococcaceae bacterium]